MTADQKKKVKSSVEAWFTKRAAEKTFQFHASQRNVCRRKENNDFVIIQEISLAIPSMVHWTCSWSATSTNLLKPSIQNSLRFVICKVYPFGQAGGIFDEQVIGDINGKGNPYDLVDGKWESFGAVLENLKSMNASQQHASTLEKNWNRNLSTTREVEVKAEVFCKRHWRHLATEADERHKTLFT